MRFAAFFINPHLALSYDPVNTAARYIPELFKQEIIEPLVDLGSSYLNQAYGGFLWV